MHYHVRAMGEVARALDITVSAGEQTYTLQGVADLIAAGGITGLMQCAALCHAHGVELVPYQTQPTIRHGQHALDGDRECTLPSRSRWRTIHAASMPSSRTLQSRRAAHSRCRRVRVSASRSSSRASSRSDAGPPVTDLRQLGHGMARRSDVHRASATAGAPPTGIADGTHLGIRNEAMELEQRHGPTDRNARALRR